MKKILSGLSLIVAAAIIFSACKKEDVTAPVITLKGNKTMEWVLNTAFVDPGATATDDEDGDVTVTSDAATAVNVDLTGTYTVTYTATDAAGNTATDTRTVTVYNESKNMAGSWSVLETWDGTVEDPYTETITVSSTVNNRIIFAKFGYLANATVNANITGSTIIIPSQTLTCGTPAAPTTFVGNGTITSASSFNVGYTVNDSWGTSNVTAVYTKQ